MLTLGLNTAGLGCALALVRDQQTLSEVSELMRRGQDARLPGLLKDLLDQAGCALSDLDRIGVVTGPGSFTGVRVGVSFARGLALALKIPCIGVTSLEATLPEGQQGSALVLLPAQKRPPDITFWAQRFRTGVATSPAEEVSLEAVRVLLSARPHMVYGDAPALTEADPSCVVHPSMPDVTRTARLATRFDPGEHPASPVYARAPDAALPTIK